jgi:hypothetical protein
LVVCIEVCADDPTSVQHKSSEFLVPSAVPQVLVYRSIPYPEVWQQPGYQALWFFQRLCLLALQCRAVYATAMAFKAPEQSWMTPAAAGQALGTAARGLL